jgi:hypothetical protein
MDLPMSPDRLMQSTWRIHLAREIADRCLTPLREPRMALLGGSPAKGLSDEYSDLDILFFWDELDTGWIEGSPLALPRTDLLDMGPGVLLESYHLDGLKADIAHVEMDVWRGMVDRVLVELDTDGDLQKSLQGFLHAVVLRGGEEYRIWRDRIAVYPPALGEKMVRENLRFFVRGYLPNQCRRRGDGLAYADGLCLMLKNILGVLGGLNRVYLSKDEPRWLEWELGRMEFLPERTLERMKEVLSAEPQDAEAVLDGLILDVLDLAGRLMPSSNAAYRRRRYLIEVLPCSARPALGSSRGGVRS